MARYFKKFARPRPVGRARAVRPNQRIATLAGVAWALALGAGAGACATSGNSQAGPGGGSSTDWSTSSSGGMGPTGGGGQGAGDGAGGAVGGAGAGADGGAGGAAGSGGAGGGGGAAPMVRALLMASGGNETLAGAYAEGAAWQTQMMTTTTSHRPAVALLSAGQGVALMRRTGGVGELVFSAYDAGVWTPFAPVAADHTTLGAPTLAAELGAVRALYHGDDSKHYFASYDGGWAPTNEAVDAGGGQSFGPSPAAVTTLGATVVMAQAGDDTQLYIQEQIGANWQDAAVVANSHITTTPAIVAPTTGPDLMVVWVNSEAGQTNDKKLMWSVRKNSNWSVVALLHTDAFTDDALSLAALPGGEALVTYRGTDGKGYFSHYAPASDPLWSAPAALVAADPDMASPPVVAPGIGSSDAELAYVDSADGAAYHARFESNLWSLPEKVGGSTLVQVGIATAP